MVIKRLLNVLLVLVLVVLTSLLVITVPASALSQPIVSIAACQNNISRVDADYTITFDTGRDLETYDTITVTFPIDTIVDYPYAGNVTASIAASPGWVAGHWMDATVSSVTWATTNPLGSSPRQLIATLGTGDVIGEDATVQITITDGLTNPSGPGDYTLTVKTSDEITPVESNTYVIAMTAHAPEPFVSIPTNQNIISQADADYTIMFDLCKELIGAAGGGDTITITFPGDTTITTPTATISASPGWVGGTWQNAVVTNVSWTSNAILRTITATLGAGDVIGEGASVRIEITAGLTNPSSPGDYTLAVHTSQETTPVESNAYLIVVGWASTNAATDISNNSATLNGTLDSLGGYTIIHVSFLWGTTSGGPYPNETGPQEMKSIGPFSAGIDGLSPHTTYYFRAKATNSLTDYGDEFRFDTRTQPTVSIAVGQNTISRADADYAILFTLGKDLEAGDIITITFPTGTIVATQTTGTDGTSGNVIGTVKASPGWVSGNWTTGVTSNTLWTSSGTTRTVTLTVGAGDAYGEDSTVRVFIDTGITNPPSPGSYTLTVKTSDEPTAVTSSIYAITTPMMVPSTTLWGGLAMVVVLGLLVVYMVRRRQTA